tara:strand:- start:728 stop:1741 length:1014 start_codon:yes stop_codon:yes gene_type:complete
MQVTLEEVLNYLTKRSLLEKEVLTEQARTGEDISIDETVIKFPSLKITEKYYGQVRKGDLEVEDRAILDKYIKNVGNDFSSRLRTLNDYATGKAATTDTSQVISAILLLDLLTAMVRQFTPSVSGFLWEGFAAALFEGTQIQTAGSNTVLTDIISNIDIETGEKTKRSVPYSLKLIQNGGVVSGSKALLQQSWDDFGSMTYIVANKIGEEALAFYLFTLDPKNTPIGVETQLDDDGDEDKGRYVSVKDAGTKFKVNAGEYKKFPMGGENNNILSLANSREMANQYAAVLGKELKAIYNALYDLSKNLENYFVGNDKGAAAKASRNAGTLKYQINKIK